MTSEEIASADANLAEIARLRDLILQWEDTYDRLAGAFDLRMAIDEFHASLSDYAGGFYDVMLGELAERADYWRVQAQDTLIDLHAAEADHRRLRAGSQLAANTLFTLSYRGELDDNTRTAIKQAQLALDSALHDPPREIINAS